MIVVIYILIVIIGFLIMQLIFLKDQLKITEKTVNAYKDKDLISESMILNFKEQINHYKELVKTYEN